MPASLHIGIKDYPGTGMDLLGCVTDALAWAKKLTGKFGFSPQLLLNENATKQNIENGILRLLEAKDPLKVITFSGHGTVVADDNGDEEADQALCPYDVMDKGPIVDDWFNQVTREGRIVLVFDSCFSGGMSKRLDGKKVRFLPPSLFSSITHPIRAIKRFNDHKNCLLISGCEDEESSWDGVFYGKPMGAFSFYALKHLTPNIRYSKWMSRIHSDLPQQYYPQTPQLVGAKRLTREFVFNEDQRQACKTW